MKNIDIVVKKTIPGDINKLFEYIVPIDLSLIFKKSGLIPGIKRTSNTTKWYQAGMSRIVSFDDGSEAQETLTSIIPPSSFTYEIVGFTSPLKFFINKINGHWDFQEADKGQVVITWKYSLQPKNFFGSIMVQVIIAPNIRKVLNQALDIIEENFKKM